MKEGQHNDSAGKGACCLGRPHELEPQDVHGEKKDAGLTYAHMSWRMLPCASLYTSHFFFKEEIIMGILKNEGAKRPPYADRGKINGC